MTSEPYVPGILEHRSQTSAHGQIQLTSVFVWPLSKSLSFCESQFPHLLNRETDLTWRGYNKEVVEGCVDSLAHRGRPEVLDLLLPSGGPPWASFPASLSGISLLVP